MKAKKTLLFIFLTTLSIHIKAQTQIQSSDIWYSGNNTVLGNSGQFLQPYGGYNNQNNKSIQLFGNSTNYGIPNLIFVKSSHSNVLGGSLIWLSDSFQTSEKRFAQFAGKINNGRGSLNFYTRSETDPSSQFNSITMDDKGNLGVGISNPSASLEINKADSGIKILTDQSHQPFITLGMSQMDRWSIGAYEATNNQYKRTFFIYEDHTGVNGSKGVRFAIKPNGNIGIGTLNPDMKLTVKGNIHAEEVKIDLNVPAPDYVFKEGYNLRTIEEVEEFIERNSHLPEIPSAKEFKQNGVMQAEMDMNLLKKIEELTLYTIQQQKEIESLKKENEEVKLLNTKLLELQSRLEKLESEK